MKTKEQTAFTLIETLVVVAGIAALTAALLLPMIRRLDELARKNEAVKLKRMADAFEERICTTKVIPNENGWASAVGTQLGLDLNSVMNNDRGLRRVFLIDPVLAVGNNSSAFLPYTQSINGHTITNAAGAVQRPISPRLILLSSVSTPLPTFMTSGVPTTSTIFNDVWAAADGTIPAGWTWNGRGEDLKVQRIDLGDLFVQIILNRRDTNLVPSYAIDQAGTSTVPYGGRIPTYFLKGSELRLYNAVGVLEYAEVLSDSRSFTFEFGTWEPETYLANSISQPSAVDLQRVMDMFMASPTNIYAKAGASQTVVSNAVVNYLTQFIAWRDGTPSYKDADKNKQPNALKDAQVQMEDVMVNLIAVH